MPNVQKYHRESDTRLCCSPWLTKKSENSRHKNRNVKYANKYKIFGHHVKIAVPNHSSVPIASNKPQLAPSKLKKMAALSTKSVVIVYDLLQKEILFPLPILPVSYQSHQVHCTFPGSFLSKVCHRCCLWNLSLWWRSVHELHT